MHPYRAMPCEPIKTPCHCFTRAHTVHFDRLFALGVLHMRRGVGSWRGRELPPRRHAAPRHPVRGSAAAIDVVSRSGGVEADSSSSDSVNFLSPRIAERAHWHWLPLKVSCINQAKDVARSAEPRLAVAVFRGNACNSGVTVDHKSSPPSDS